MLDEACARNLSAEMHYELENELRTARMRLIRIGDEGIEVDMPQAIGQEVALEAGAEVKVYFSRDQEFYAFDTTVRRSVVSVDLNKRKRVTGMVLALPAELVRQQRRQDFRVSLSRHELAVTCHDLPEGETAAAPRDAWQYTGRLVNISRGGVAAIFDASAVQGLAARTSLFLICQLPEIDAPVLLPVEVRNIRRVHEGQKRVVGLVYIDTDNPLFRAAYQLIDEFIAAEQRRQLRKRTGGQA